MANKMLAALKNILGKDDDEEETLDPTEAPDEDSEDLPPPVDEEETEEVPGDEAPDASGEDEGGDLDSVEDDIENAENAMADADADPSDPEAQAAADEAVAAAMQAAESAGVPEDPKDAADDTLADLSERLVPLSVWAKALLEPDADEDKKPGFAKKLAHVYPVRRLGTVTPWR